MENLEEQDAPYRNTRSSAPKIGIDSDTSPIRNSQQDSEFRTPRTKSQRNKSKKGSKTPQNSSNVSDIRDYFAQESAWWQPDHSEFNSQLDTFGLVERDISVNHSQVGSIVHGSIDTLGWKNTPGVKRKTQPNKVHLRQGSEPLYHDKQLAHHFNVNAFSPLCLRDQNSGLGPTSASCESVNSNSSESVISGEVFYGSSDNLNSPNIKEVINKDQESMSLNIMMGRNKNENHVVMGQDVPKGKKVMNVETVMLMFHDLKKEIGEIKDIKGRVIGVEQYQKFEGE